MSHRFRFSVAIAAVVGCLSVPLPGQGQERVEYSLRSETGLAGAFLDPLYKQPVWFNASAEEGAFTVRLDLYAQSVTVLYGQGELHISSSNNTAHGFGTLSDEERQVLRRLAALLDKELATQSAFQASVLCMLRNLGSWPADMPLSVSVDSVMTTVGEVSVPTEEIREARRRAMNEAGLLLPDDETGITKSITSLCSQIGRARTACYPTSLRPYAEKCEAVLLGGTPCRGRCGTLCNGLCSKERYTQDCHNHDRCADIYGLTHRYCNFIFPSTIDDCFAAPNCVDLPGVWTLTFNWTGSTPGTTPLDIVANRKFTTGDGGAGTWSANEKNATITYTVGCKPVYTGTLSANRLTASGKMRCTTKSIDGTWSASKTDGILPPASASQANGAAPAPDRGAASSGPPD